MNLAPPIYSVLQANVSVRSVLGNPVRVYSFGQAEASPNLAKPYLVWQTIGGTPENYLGDRPEVDTWNIQVDIWADDAKSARSVAEKVLNAVEGVAYVMSFNGEDRDPTTGDFRFSFDVDWIVHR